MQAENKHSIFNLLKKWLDGTARRKEESQLESLAKDDPFLADAMDGYRTFPEKDHALRVAALKDRLKNRSGQKRAIIFSLRRIAATVALIILAGGAFWLLNPKFNQQDHPATSDATAPPREKEIVQESGSSDDKPELSTQKEVAPPISKQKPQPLQPKKQEIKEPIHQEKRDEVKAMEIPEIEYFDETEITEVSKAEDSISSDDLALPSAAEKNKAVEIISSEDIASNEASPVLKPKDALSREKANIQILEARIITGVITAENGEPLIGVAVSAKGTDVRTISGFDGRYALTVPVESDEITLDYLGFMSISSKIGDSDTMDFVVPEAIAQLDEVVVTGYGEKKKKNANSSRTTKEVEQQIEQLIATPRKGFKKYERYIRKNLNYPFTAKDVKIEGIVKVEFSLDNEGAPIDLKILQSLGYGCDKEAIRLIKEGPAWIGVPGKIVVYSIEFKL